MKKTLLLFAIAVSVAVLGSCNRDSETVGVGGVGIKLTATADFPAAAGTRVSVDNGTGAVSWSAGDAIALFDNHSTTNSSFALQSAGGTNATFSGLIKTGGALADRVFYAIYPYGAGTFAGTTCTLDLPAEQSGNVANYLYMVADPLPFSGDPVTQNITLNFRQLMALVEVDVTNIPSTESVVKVQLATVNPSVTPFALKGTIDIAAAGGDPAVTQSDFSNSLQTKAVVSTGATSAKASLALFPVDFSTSPTDLQISVITTDGTQYYDYTVDKLDFDHNISRHAYYTTDVALDAVARRPYDMPNPTMQIADITLSAAAGPGNTSTSQAGIASCVYVSSLTGLANRRMPSIYLEINTNNPGYLNMKNEMISEGYTFTTTNLATLNTKFLTHDLVKGLVIVDDGCVRTPLAASLAGALDAVIVTDAMSKTSTFSGFPVLASVSDNTDALIKVVNEDQLADYIAANPSKFNLTGIVNYQTKSTDVNTATPPVTTFSPWQMIDFAIKFKYPMCGPEQSSTASLARLYKSLKPNSPHFGWNVPYGDEYKDVTFAAEQNAIYTVSAMNIMSMSLFSSAQIKPIFRNRPAPDVTTMPLNKHYLTIIFSDGDNMGYNITRYATEQWPTTTPPTTTAAGTSYPGQYKFILNPDAGKVPLNYMYPVQELTNLTPLHNYYQKTLKPNNYQVCAISGMGYTLPSHIPAANQSDYFTKTDQAMKECGLDYLVDIDENTTSFGGTSNSVYTRFAPYMQYLSDVKGIFYANYQEYSSYNGQCFFIGDVPVVSFRYCLWDGVNKSTFKNPTQLATLLNAASHDATKIDAYTAIVALVNDPAYYDVNRIVNELVPQLSSDVVIVDADQFMRLIKQNVKGNVPNY